MAGPGFDSANQNMPDSLPEKYEMGTLNIAGVAGLNASLKWIKGQTIERLYQEETIKRQRLLELLSDYDFLKVVGNVDGRKYVGIVSCLIDGLSSDSAGSIFAERVFLFAQDYNVRLKLTSFLELIQLEQFG